ncbi:hypothetical protein [Azotobacter armeniacus]
MSHGLPKLLGTSHGSMGDPMAASISLIRIVLHLPAPAVFALCVALLEGIGGLLCWPLASPPGCWPPSWRYRCWRSPTFSG